MRRKKTGEKHPLVTFLYLMVGSVLSALPFPLFFIPNDIAPGGLSGIGTLLHALLGVPVGAMSALLNAPLFLLSWKRMGHSFAVKSLIAMLTVSALTDLLPLQPVTREPMLAALFGGVLMGVGIALVIRGGATTGGTDMAATLIHGRLPILSMGGILLALDFLVIAASGVIFSAQSMMYSLITIFMITHVIDRVVEGLDSAKAFFVFSARTSAIADAVLTRIGRGVTLLHAKGAYSGAERDVLLCVITRLQIAQFRSVVKEIDPDAFVMVTDVREAMGEGFSKSL